MIKNQNKTLLHLPLTDWIGLGIFLIIIVIMFFIYPSCMGNTQTPAEWLAAIWNDKSDYEHGWMIPLFSVFMSWHAAKTLKDEPVKGNLNGLWIIALGAFFFLVSLRTLQPRAAIVSFPFLMWGAVWVYWGKRFAYRLTFPFFYILLAIPMPGIQQATVHLQLMSTEMAHWGANLFGVETIMEGTTIHAVNSDWDTFNIAGGCSGIRSLMALLMISIAWAYLADKMALWKRVILALSAIPLAIVGNGFRVASILICAEHINPAFAGKAWHDWSGLLLFFPATLFGLTVLHSLLAGEIPFIKKRKVVIRRSESTASETTTEQKGEQSHD